MSSKKPKTQKPKMTPALFKEHFRMGTKYTPNFVYTCGSIDKQAVFWAKAASGRELDWPVGSVANGERYVTFFGKTYPVRFIAYTIQTGHFPGRGRVVHMDGNKLNNDINNLHFIPKK